MIQVSNNDFKLEIIKGLCQDSISRIYGFILYTRRHANVANFLQNQNYWNCLDDISGDNWPIFAVRPLDEGHYKQSGSSNIPGAISMMISEWHEPNSNRQILDSFGLKESKDLPCFIGFIWDDKDELQQFVWKIDEKSIDTVYSSLKEIVTLISDAEGRVSDNLKSSECVWEEVIMSLKNEKSITQKVKFFVASTRAVELFGSAASIASLLA